MSRTGQSQDEAASNAASANAAAANARTTAAVDKYNSDLAALQSGKNPFGTSPFESAPYLQNENLNFATQAHADANADKEAINNEALRTGSNSASFLSAIENNRRRREQTLNANYNAQRSNDYLNDVNWQQAMLNADLAPTGTTNTQYGTSITGLDSANNALTQFGLASYGPWQSAIQAAGAAVGGAAGGYFQNH